MHFQYTTMEHLHGYTASQNKEQMTNNNNQNKNKKRHVMESIIINMTKNSVKVLIS